MYAFKLGLLGGSRTTSVSVFCSRNRRMAMKRATDAAEEMLGNYTRLYNRSRQAGITQQLAEIVSGASALE